MNNYTSGSCDNGTRIWRHTEQSGWQEETLKGQGHTGKNGLISPYNTALRMRINLVEMYSPLQMCINSIPMQLLHKRELLLCKIFKSIQSNIVSCFLILTVYLPACLSYHLSPSC
jgi:hypothetical protein